LVRGNDKAFDDNQYPPSITESGLEK